jgi:RNA polymerase nonessential primary-like sigma factor
MIYLVNMWLNKQDGLQSEELARRFGLWGYQNSTLEAISEMMKINREKMRQIQNVRSHRFRNMMEDQGILQDVIS